MASENRLTAWETLFRNALRAMDSVGADLRQALRNSLDGAELPPKIAKAA